MDDGAPSAHGTPTDMGGQGFDELPVEITISVGTARPTIGDLLALGPDAVLPLDRRIADPVELYIGNKLIARGELEERDDGTDGLLAVRLTEIVGPRAGG